MDWKNFGSSLAITRRRRVVATALVYGLSLSVRFVSTTGEETDTTTQAAQGRDPMMSIMIKDTAPILDKDWLPGMARPIAFHRGASPGSRGCRAACEIPMPPFVPSCASRP